MKIQKPNANRIEHDALGTYPVPSGAYFGIHTARAATLAVSSHRFDRRLLRALGTLKHGAAWANRDLGLLGADLAGAIASAAQEVARGDWDAEFILDVFQTGSGTSLHMNANEVIANRANEILGLGSLGAYSPVHPNDHVNMGQSSNDVVPTAIHLAALCAVHERLSPALTALEAVLTEKAAELDGVVKTGRTHLMDATPIRMGQEFLGFAGQTAFARERLIDAAADLCEVPLGGTAVGTGVNTHPEFAARTLAYINEELKTNLFETTNHFRSPSGIDQLAALSGALRGAALALTKIASDVRLMASGPRAGIAEIEIPEIQPGSSIMPGKVNPVVPEVVLQVAAQVVGNDATVTIAAQSGYFELNTMFPVVAYNILESCELLANAAELLASRCVAGIKATGRGPALVESSAAMATPLARLIGYERAAEVAKEALKRGVTVREVAAEMVGLTESELDGVLDAKALTGRTV